MSDFEKRDNAEKRSRAAILFAFRNNIPTGDVLTESELSSLETDLESNLEKPIDYTINSTIEQAINDYGIDATVAEIREKIGMDSEGLASGIAKEIVDATDGGDLEKALGKIRADVIATTTTTAINTGSIIAISQAGFFDDVLRWRTEEDETVCEFCGPKNNGLVSVVGQPPEHPNCRCWIE